MVHSTATLQPQSVRLLLAIAAIFGFDIWTADIRQAYLQASEPIGGHIFIKRATPEFELSPDQCLQVLQPLYGLCDAGDLWHTTLDKHRREEMRMEQFKTDCALYYQQGQKKLEGMSGFYVDDLLRTGNAIFDRNRASRIRDSKWQKNTSSRVNSRVSLLIETGTGCCA